MRFLVLSICLMTVLIGCGVQWFPDDQANVVTPPGTTAPVVNTTPFVNTTAGLTATLSPFQVYSTSDTVAAHYRVTVTVLNNSTTNAVGAQLIVAPQDTTNSATIPGLGLSFSATSIPPAQSQALTQTARVLFTDVSRIKLWEIVSLSSF